MFTRSALLMLLLCGPSFAQSGDPGTGANRPAPEMNFPAAPLLPPSTAVPADGVPLAGGEWFYSERSTAPIFGMDVILGQQTGIRPNFTLFSTPHSTLVLEGFYGALLTNLGTSEGAGAGLRWNMTRGGDDSVTFGPGIDVMFNFRDGAATFLAPTIDLAWQHKFGQRASFLLGLNAGIGIGISGSDDDHSYYETPDSVSGKITPLISIFGGLRF